MFKCLFHVYDNIFDLFCFARVFAFFHEIRAPCQLRCIFCIVCTFFPIAFLISSTYRNPTDNFVFVEQMCFTGASIPKFRHWTNGHALKLVRPHNRICDHLSQFTLFTQTCADWYICCYIPSFQTTKKPSPKHMQKWGLAKELQVWSSSPIYFGTLKVFQEILG